MLLLLTQEQGQGAMGAASPEQPGTGHGLWNTSCPLILGGNTERGEEGSTGTKKTPKSHSRMFPSVPDSRCLDAWLGEGEPVADMACFIPGCQGECCRTVSPSAAPGHSSRPVPTLCPTVPRWRTCSSPALPTTGAAPGPLLSPSALMI